MPNLRAAPITGVFDTDAGRLVGVAPEGTSAVSFFPTQGMPLAPGSLPVSLDPKTQKTLTADQAGGLLIGGRDAGLSPRNIPSLDVPLTYELPPWLTLTRASTKTYLGENGLLQTAPANSPAFEFDKDGNALGLSVEPAARNICLNSSDYATSSWVIGGVAISRDQIAPDGSSTASLITETNLAPEVKQTVPITAGQLVTRSVFLKKANCDWIKLSLSDAATYQNGVTAWFNLDTGQTGSVIPCPWGSATVAPVNFGSHIENVGGGWYRCFMWASIPSAISLSFSSVMVEDDADLYVSTLGHSRIQWGEQFVAGVSPDLSSYIPTSASAVSRSADFISGALMGYTPGGALVIGYTRKTPSVTNLDQVVAQLDDGTLANVIRVSDCYDANSAKFNQKIELIAESGTPRSALLHPVGRSDSSLLVSSANYSTVISKNGRASSDYYASSPSAFLSRIILGSTEDGSRGFCGSISRIQLLPDRQSFASAKSATRGSGGLPSNPLATDEAVSLYGYLKGVDGQTLFGFQFKGIREVGGSWQVANAANYPTGGNEQVVTRLLTQSGYPADYPVMVGLSDQLWAPLGASGVSDVLDPKRVDSTERVIGWFKQGRIISILTDMPNFVGPTALWPQGSQTMSAGGDGDLGALTPSGENASMCARRISPGGDLNGRLVRYLQSLCGVLNSLQINGIRIPIILRLFRESRMGVFWWNIFSLAPDGEQYVPDEIFIANYRFCIDYIRSRCPQVLINFCMATPYLSDFPMGQKQSWYTSVYPGDDYVDILSIDPYDDASSPGGSLDSRWLTKALQACRYLADKSGKPFAYAEVGFKWSAQNWSSASATAKGYSASTGYSAPNSFWDGVCLEQMKRQGSLPAFTLWWGEAWAPYYGCPTTASAVAFLRSPLVLMASKVSRKEIYGV